MHNAGPHPIDRLLKDDPGLGNIRSQTLHRKRVLITGAGGSIGSALMQSVLASHPESLVLLDSSENGLYQIDRKSRELGGKHHIPILGDIGDRSLLTHLFENHRPQIVFHAAACKHVPLMERNPFAAITTNALGTLLLAETADTGAAEQFILVSTDKAAAPHSIMGASKRIAELTVLSLRTHSGTKMRAVRLGNVAGSQGSVLPLFLDQIAHGGPLTVTHPDAERFFMTLPEAVQTLFAALDIPSTPALLAPHLDPPIRILDLARHLLNARGSTASIAFTGLRPGDKLTEWLLAPHERWLPGTSALRSIETPVPASSVVRNALHELGRAAQTYDLAHLLRIVLNLVPEYQPSALLHPALVPETASA